MTRSVLPTGLSQALESFSPGLPLAVALSGGADSTALLVGCAEKWPGQVVAVHVHHGLQPAADDFEQHCMTLCAGLKVPLAIERIHAAHAPGESPEDAARKARYSAFRTVVDREWSHLALRDIAIGQHADDEVETILLALSRGAGLPGLAAMPANWTRHGLAFHRPLLAVHAADLRAWLTQRGISWVEDPTNGDQRFTRNRIRARLMPALEEAFPQFRETFARTARHAAHAKALLEDVACEDLLKMGTPPRIAVIRTLTPERQANALRHWLRLQDATPSTAQLDQLLLQVSACTTRGHQIHLKIADGHVGRTGDVLTYVAAGT